MKEKIKECLIIKDKYEKLYREDSSEEGMEVEKKYLTLRGEILSEINNKIERKKSIPLSVIRKEVDKEEKPIPIETGIISLDRQLTSQEDFNLGKSGGLPLGNLINIVGAKGTGKTTLLMRIISGFSAGAVVSWFNFEMSNRQVIEKIKPFNANEDNILYYTASRELEDVSDEIKFLNATGIKHFVIDSNMKMKCKQASNQLDKHTIVSDTLKELTSVLDINIYLINQISQQSERDGALMLKGGNDAEFDSDLILFIMMKPLKDAQGKNQIDEIGMTINDDNHRFVKCTKNRIYDRLFSFELPKREIMPSKAIVIEYQSADQIEMPIL